jgi:hypothetical protein
MITAAYDTATPLDPGAPLDPDLAATGGGGDPPRRSREPFGFIEIVGVIWVAIAIVALIAAPVFLLAVLNTGAGGGCGGG